MSAGLWEDIARERATRIARLTTAIAALVAANETGAELARQAGDDRIGLNDLPSFVKRRLVGWLEKTPAHALGALAVKEFATAQIAAPPSVAEAFEVKHCLGCGCDDAHACRHEDGTPCSWGVLVDEAHGICSKCIGIAARVGSLAAFLEEPGEPHEILDPAVRVAQPGETLVTAAPAIVQALEQTPEAAKVAILGFAEELLGYARAFHKKAKDRDKPEGMRITLRDLAAVVDDVGQAIRILEERQARRRAPKGGAR